MGRKPVFGLAGLLLASTTLTGCWGDRDTIDAGRYTPPPPGNTARPQFGGQQPYPWPRQGNGQQQNPVMGNEQSSAQFPAMGGNSSIGQTQPGSGMPSMNQNPMMGGSVPSVQNPAMGSGASSQWNTQPASNMGRSTSMNTSNWPQSPAVGQQASFPSNAQFPGGMTNSPSPMAGGANQGMNPPAWNSGTGSSVPQVSQSTLRFAGNTSSPSPFASRPMPPISNEVSPPDVSRPMPPAGYPAFQSGTGSSSSANSGITPVSYNQSQMAMPPSSDLPPAQAGAFNSQSRYSGEIHEVSGSPPAPLGVPSVPVLRQGN